MELHRFQTKNEIRADTAPSFHSILYTRLCLCIFSDATCFLDNKSCAKRLILCNDELWRTKDGFLACRKMTRQEFKSFKPAIMRHSFIHLLYCDPLHAFAFVMRVSFAWYSCQPANQHNCKGYTPYIGVGRGQMGGGGGGVSCPTWSKSDKCRGLRLSLGALQPHPVNVS